MSGSAHEYMKQGSHFFLPDLNHDDDKDGYGSGWRAKLTAFLSSGKVSIVLSSLLIVDLAAVVAEILIQAHKHCETGVTCAGDEPAPASGGHHRLLSAPDPHAPADPHGAGENGTVFGLLPGCQLLLRAELTHELEEAEHVLRMISLIVLFIFAIELALVWLGMGMKFLRTPALVLDFVVVYVSLVVDLALHNSAELAELLVLLIITRLWRFVRIFHALGMTVHEIDEKKYEHELHELKDELAKEQEEQAVDELAGEINLINRKVTLLKKAKEHMNDDNHMAMPKVNCAEHAKTAASWRTNLVKFLSSHTVSVVLSVMLLLDLVVVVTEVVLATFAKCHGTVVCHGDEPSGGAAGHGTEAPGHGTEAPHGTGHATEAPGHGTEAPAHLYRLLSEAAAGLAKNATGLVAGCEIEAEMELSHTLEETEHVLRYISLIILFAFAIELLLLMIGMGCRFFKQPLLVLDAIVVYASLILDFVYHSNASYFAEVVVLLFITRMWRFIRIFHALGMTVHEVDEAKFEKEKHHLEEEIQIAHTAHIHAEEIKTAEPEPEPEK